MFGLAGGCASVHSPTRVSPPSSSRPALETLRRNPFSEGQRTCAALGLYALHSFATTICECTESKYVSENAWNGRGRPRGSPTRSSGLETAARSACSRGQKALAPSWPPPASAREASHCPGLRGGGLPAPLPANRCICSSQPNEQQGTLFKLRISAPRVTLLPSQHHHHK